MRSTHILLFFLILLINSCSKPNVQDTYIDTDFPGSEPKLFADSVFAPMVYNKCVFIAQDKTSVYFQSCGPGFCKDILRLQKDQESGSFKVDTIISSHDIDSVSYCAEPWISYDMQEMYFAASGNIWKMSLKEDKWCNPVKLGKPVNTDWHEGHPTISENNTLYYHSWEKTPYENAVYFSKYKDGKFIDRQKIDILSEIGDAGDPAIARDESFIIFVSSRDGGYGLCDLYISFNNNGQWGKPINLGPKVNTEMIELSPTITSDGKYLLFYRRDKWANASYIRVYWVDIQQVLVDINAK